VAGTSGDSCADDSWQGNGSVRHGAVTGIFNHARPAGAGVAAVGNPPASPWTLLAIPGTGGTCAGTGNARPEISLGDIARRVGLAKSNLLRYFESREDVFLQLPGLWPIANPAPHVTAMYAEDQDPSRCGGCGDNVLVRRADQALWVTVSTL
jgi:Bacterial regulatory proteins, tetR family